MKLWTKISMICAVVLLIVAGISDSLLLKWSRENMLNLAVEGEKARQHNLAVSYIKLVSSYDATNTTRAAKNSLVMYFFTAIADPTCVLVSDSETLISNIAIHPERLLPLNSTNAYHETQQYSIYNSGNENFLIVGSLLQTGFKSDTEISYYKIYTVKNITGVYEDVARITQQFTFISVGCIAAGITLLIVLLHMTLLPLKKLNAATQRISAGEYQKRATIKSKDEVGTLARDFNIMAEAVQHHVEELQETAERQQLFITGLTHEFKTPLTSLIGYSELLLYTKLPEKTAFLSLTHINEQCKWLERLTQKLLKLVTLNETPDLKEASVSKLLETITESVGETFRKRGITLQTECKMDKLPMDEDLMTSMLINLVDNAAKASEPGQIVFLRAHDNMFEVSDSGMGIPLTELSRITEPFYMVDRSRSKAKGGSGIGLALVKKIADAHEAKLVFESKPGIGTTVKIIFHDNKTFTFR